MFCRPPATGAEPFVYGSLGGDDVALVPAPVAPTPSGPVNADIRRDYELAERIGTKAGWDAFIGNYPNGFYTELAKAQRDKLTATSTTKPTAEPPAPDKAADQKAADGAKVGADKIALDDKPADPAPAAAAANLADLASAEHSPGGDVASTSPAVADIPRLLQASCAASAAAPVRSTATAEFLGPEIARVVQQACRHQAERESCEPRCAGRGQEPSATASDAPVCDPDRQRARSGERCISFVRPRGLSGRRRQQPWSRSKPTRRPTPRQLQRTADITRRTASDHAASARPRSSGQIIPTGLRMPAGAEERSCRLETRGYSAAQQTERTG